MKFQSNWHIQFFFSLIIQANGEEVNGIIQKYFCFIKSLKMNIFHVLRVIMQYFKLSHSEYVSGRIGKDSQLLDCLCMGALSCSCPTTLQPHGLQPARLLCPQHFFRQEYWSGQPFHPPGDLPYLRVKPESPILQVGSSPAEPSEIPLLFVCFFCNHLI